MGIIAALKVRYEHALLERTIAILPYKDSMREKFKNLKNGTLGIEEDSAPHVLDEAEFVSRIWPFCVRKELLAAGPNAAYFLKMRQMSFMKSIGFRREHSARLEICMITLRSKKEQRLKL